MSKYFKKTAIVFIAVLLLALNASAKDSGGNTSKKIDIDLTRMSSTMVYAQVYKMVTEPVKFIGKRIRMKGVFSSYYDYETKKRFYGCVIADALACCSQGLAFEPAKDRKFPDDGEKITIIGDFEMAEDGDDAYCDFALAQNFVDRYEEPTPGYITAGAVLEIRWKLALAKYSLVIRTDNIFDADVRNHLSRLKSVMPEKGRNFSVLAKAEF